ncbi:MULTISPECIES: baeRF2 domain-containing protein [unclassified Arthrobacter]|uniref:baeRF2 domain-containing protein n=1 Tax=unclassified Arthrobacter TaxID=235627 RepID=UPI0003709EF3|nr:MULTISPECIES: Vms1/Ankzf1 family peptidyl-tRNA hydrolase [unclassified Arthrobacter]
MQPYISGEVKVDHRRNQEARHEAAGHHRKTVMGAAARPSRVEIGWGEMTAALHSHSALYKRPGPWCTIYMDASTGSGDSLHADDARPDAIAAALHKAGAGRQDIQAVGAALGSSAKGLPDPVARFLLVNDGEVAFDEFLPGRLVMQEVHDVGPVPNLVPLVRHRPQEFAYVVAEAGRDGGTIHLHRVNRSDDESTEVEGSTENLKKIPGGGTSQGGYLHRTENIWRANAGEIADEIDRVVRNSRAKLLILAGDIRARNLVAEQLSEASRAILSVVESHTRTDGADRDAFAREVSSRVAACVAGEQQQLLERFENQQGREHPESVAGLGAVVHALQQGQVGTLLIERSAWDEQRLLALAAEPWIAASTNEISGARLIGTLSAPSALLRAAALTDADVVLFPPGALDPHRIAALLRWPLGPTTP